MEQNAAPSPHLPISDRLAVWFDDENNRKRAIIYAVILAVVALACGYYLNQRGKKEELAGQALAQLMTSAFLSGGSQPPSPEAYLKIATDHPGTPAAQQSILLAGSRYYGDGKYAEAQAQFQRLNREFPGNPFMGEAALGVAATLESQGKIDEAAKAYKEAGERYPGPGTVQAKYSLARILESQGNLEGARTLYEDIVRVFQNHSLANESSLRLEELSRRMPRPAPEPVAPAFTPAPDFQPKLTNLPAPPKP